MIAEARTTSGPLPACTALPGRTPCIYTLGFVAVDLLLRQGGGLPAFIDFWKLIGDGLTWPDAFANAK